LPARARRSTINRSRLNPEDRPVLLYEPGQSPYDLRFRLFGVPVRVHPLFWLMCVVLGYGFTQTDSPATGNIFGDLALWVGCVFVSILLHEFGHVWTGQAFGSHGYIVLHLMGGLAIGSSDLGRRWQRIAVSAAGPAIQLVLWGALIGAVAAGWLPDPAKGSGTPARLLLYMLLWINLYWPLFNLLPIWPLDGGKVTRDVCQAASERQGLVVSLWISMVVSACLAVYSLLAEAYRPRLPFVPADGYFLAIFLASFAIGSYQGLQEEKNRYRGWESDWPSWRR
jgi:Zn-dependent protease